MANCNRRYQMAKNAYRDVELYRHIAVEYQMDVESFDWVMAWERIPVITKNMIRSRMADLLAPQYIFWENTSRMQSVFTSGTTGLCLEVLWLIEDVKMSLMPLWLRRIKKYSISPGDRLCTFFSSRQYGREDKWYQLSGNELAFAKEELNEDRLLDIYEMLVENKIKWMIVQPSILQLLYQFMCRKKLPVWKELAYIEVTGEYMQEKFYQNVRQMFQVPVLNQYGTYEVNTIAYGEGTGYLDVVDSNVYVEIVDDEGHVLPDGEEGNVCVTCLTNRAMPFIRYLVGDKGKMRNVPDSSGVSKRQLCLTRARCADLIHLKNGININPYVLQKAVEITNHIMDDVVIQFRFIQTDYDIIRVELVTSGEYPFSEVCRFIRDHIYQKELTQVQFLFDKKDYLLLREGKEKWGWFCSEIK